MTAALIAAPVAGALTDDGTARPPILYIHSSHRGHGMYGAVALFDGDQAAQFAGPDGVTEYVRRDVMDAPLAHLAEQVKKLQHGIAIAMADTTDDVTRKTLEMVQSGWGAG